MVHGYWGLSTHRSRWQREQDMATLAVAPKMTTWNPLGHCRSRVTGTVTICGSTLVPGHSHMQDRGALWVEMCTFQANP